MTSHFVTAEEGEALRAQRLKSALANYKPKHTPQEYLEFMNARSCADFKKNHSQDMNWPQVFTLFTIPSQHVRGDCIEECLDIAMERMEQRIRGDLDRYVTPRTIANYEQVWDLPEGSTWGRSDRAPHE